jgi:hypothetical protein
MLRFRGFAFTGVIAAALVLPVQAGELDDPTDPGAPVPPVVYRPVMSGYQDTTRTTRPADWRELNDRMERIGGPRGQLRDVDEPIRER